MYIDLFTHQYSIQEGFPVLVSEQAQSLKLLGCQSFSSTTQVAFQKGGHNGQPMLFFLTWVNFRHGLLPGVRLGPILGCSDLTELEAKRDLAVTAQTVYLPC